MKRYVSLLVAALIFASGILMTGCSKSDQKKLTDCLTLTKSADSMEANVSGITKMNGQTGNIKMDVKVEDIHKDMKGITSMELLGQKQEFYMSVSNGTAKLYMKDNSGKYTVKSVDASQLNGIDMTKSFDSYNEVIEKNPDILKKTNDNTYELNIPKDKMSEIYSKLTGQTSTQSFDSIKIEFVIGSDGYLQKANLIATSGSNSVELDTDYSNYNKKFNIELPSASN